ncbi:hypothetical protein [Actinoallomurus vinaceus]
MFTILYWDVRILGRLNYLWFPTAPWSRARSSAAVTTRAPA